MRIVGSGGVRGLLSWLVSFGVACALLTSTSAAQAAPATLAYATAGAFAASGSDFNVPTRLAVEPTSGNILVADSANHRIQVFAPDPVATGTLLTSIGTALGVPYGIAIDQSNGDVYVSESGTDEIVRYRSDGAPTPTYTIDPSFVSPTQGAGLGQIGSFASPIAVDPTTHDVLVADTANKRVTRFDSSGTFLAPSFAGADSAGGSFTYLLDLAVGPTGTIYVIDGTGDPTGNGGIGPQPQSRIETFDSAGVAQGALGPVDTPRSVAVELSTGTVLVGGRSTAQLGGGQSPLLYVFAGSPTPVSAIAYPAQFNDTEAMGLAVAGAPSRRLYGLLDKQFGTQGTSGVQAFDVTAIPGVSVDAPTAVTSTTAHLVGRVDPGGPATDAHFEYSVVGSGDPPGATPDEHLTGSGEQLVAADVTGLEPFTEYDVRLIASNASYNASDARTFTTGPAPPRVDATGATEIDAGGAVLNGRINPLGLQTTYVFEYGETTEYGRKLPAGAAAVAGSGRVPRSFARALRGLQPGTTYHFRLVATNAQGTSTGSDAMFTTAVSDSAARGYEQVSPADKAGANIELIIGFQAKPDGNGFVYKAANVASDAESAPRYARYASLRSERAGWTSRALDGPSASAYGTLTLLTMAVSEDLSHALIVSTRELTDGGIDGNTNLYLRDLRSGSYTLIVSIDAPGAYNYFANLGSEGRFVAGAKDFSWVVFSSDMSLIPGATGGGVDQLYRWSDGKLSLVSVLPDGSPSHGTATARNTPRIPEVRAASDDGSEILFSLSTAGAEDGVYLRKGTTTIPLSVSQIGGAPTTPEPGFGTGISRDGRYAVFFVESSTPLTDDAPPVRRNLYRYDSHTGELEYLLGAVLPGNIQTQTGVLAVSDDGSHVYFADPGGDVYVWHDGAAELVSHVPEVLGTLYGFAASPNGRYFVFKAYTPLTSYDNTNNTAGACTGGRDVLFPGQCAEVYVYDADTHALACASCPADGARATGDARLPDIEISLSNRYPRTVTDRGQVFFDTPVKLVAGDVNGTADVYVYQNGRADLISPGTKPADARFADASDDGSNVFFVTGQSLVGQDQDGGAADVYDARIGGGIPAQNPVPPKAPCAGSECAEPTPGPAGSSELPSHRLTGTAGVAKPAPKPRVSIVKSSFTRSAIRVTVRVTGRGRIRASGSRVVTMMRNASAVGSYTLTVPLSKKTRSAIRRRQRVKVSVKVSFTPPFRAAVSTKLSRTLGK
ncbi:hypothetical protein [Amycolatopsis sp.]|uniref:hypothetical protein n=1 Tax=Amycolatopsis sp. TaxID=37632 RepID=UPI002DF85A37|nr:hypothetical protein [Amycolatopsis sp.]